MRKKLFGLLVMIISAFSITSCKEPQSSENENSSNIEISEDLSVLALNEAKTTAINEIESYVNLNDYRDVQKVEINNIINVCKENIDSAISVEGVTDVLNNAKVSIDNIKTNEELTNEENALALVEAKHNAINEIEGYVNINNYRDLQKAEINEAITNCVNSINAALNINDVNSILNAAKASIDSIKTDKEITEEENAIALANAKTNAITAIESYVNLNDYRDAQKTEINNIINECKNAINSASSVESVTAALNNAKTYIDNVKTNSEITALEPVITTKLENGQVFTNNKATVDVWVKNSKGQKISSSNVTVTVNGVAMSINWDDSSKTSYNLIFNEGENVIEIKAKDGQYTKSVSYVVTCNLQADTTITVAVEAFTVGIGYIVMPYNLTLNEETFAEMASMYGYSSASEMKANFTAAYALDYVLQTNNLTMDYQGDLYAGGSFYMSSITGLDTSNVYVQPELYEKLEENGFYVEEYVYDEGTLCEFDITYGSGWMYMINGVLPNVGFCDYIPQDGDVMRIQFTLAYGNDIGEEGFFGEPYFDKIDKEEFTKLIALAIEKGINVDEEITLISTFGITQEEVDSACVNLTSKINSK